MHYRCSHCYTSLEMIDEVLVPCENHPDGAVEWSVDQTQWEPEGEPDVLS